MDNHIRIMFSKNGNNKNYIKSKIISNLKKIEKLIDEKKFKNLQKDLIINLRENNIVDVIIKNNNYKILVKDIIICSSEDEYFNDSVLEGNYAFGERLKGFGKGINSSIYII